MQGNTRAHAPSSSFINIDSNRMLPLVLGLVAFAHRLLLLCLLVCVRPPARLITTTLCAAAPAATTIGR